MKRLDNYFKIAEEVAKMADSFLCKNYGQIKKMNLSHENHCCIDDDKKCNNIYEKYLREKTPEIAIYSEEGERNLNSGYVWVIDPIDGTSNYRVGIPLFVTQICLLYKNEIIFSIVRAPILKLNFYAKKNKGAYLNGKKIKISTTSTLSEAMVGFNKGASNIYTKKHLLKLGLASRTIRIYGSMGIDLAYCASGKLDALLSCESNLYDYAPGMLLLKEAGGVITNFQGKPWNSRDKTMIFTNKLLSKKIVEIL